MEIAFIILSHISRIVGTGALLFVGLLFSSSSLLPKNNASEMHATKDWFTFTSTP